MHSTKSPNMPKAHKPQKDTQLCSVRIPKQVLEKLKSRARSQERSMSWLIVNTLRDLVSRPAIQKV